MEYASFIALVISSVIGLVIWSIKGRIEMVDGLNSRVSTIETKLDVLGDISTTLHSLRTDVEVIKTKLERM